MVALELAVLLASLAGFATLFAINMRLSRQHVKVFETFSRAEQGDWGSRINSTVHSIYVVIAMTVTLLMQQWDDHYLPLKSTTPSRVCFSITCGYFVFDLYVLLRWKVPLWYVFVIHHIVAAIPYLIYNFHAGCDMLWFILSTFLLVELAVIPMNFATFMEQLGHGKTNLHTVLFYTTYVLWFGCRVLLPIFNVVMLYRYVVPEYNISRFCVLPAAIATHIIAAFCIGVFIFMWTPNVFARWRKDVSELDEYAEYELTLRQSLTPREASRSYGSAEV